MHILMIKAHVSPITTMHWNNSSPPPSPTPVFNQVTPNSESLAGWNNMMKALISECVTERENAYYSFWNEIINVFWIDVKAVVISWKVDVWFDI